MKTPKDTPGKIRKSTNEEDSETSDSSVESSENEQQIGGHANKNEIETSDSEEETENSEDSDESDAEENQKSGITKQKGEGMPKQPNGNENSEQNERTISVHHLPRTFNKAHVKQFFSRYGKIEHIKIHRSKLEKAIICIVRFENREAARKSLEVSGMEYKGSRIVVLEQRTTVDVHNRSIYIHPVPRDVETDFLWRTFESCGVVTSARVVPFMHCAFVVFESPDSVELALKMNKMIIANQEVQIKRKGEKKCKSPAKSKKPPKTSLRSQRRREMIQRRNEKKRRSPAGAQKFQRHRGSNDGNSFTITFNNGRVRGPNRGLRVQ